jgi:hypothetical protein
MSGNFLDLSLTAYTATTAPYTQPDVDESVTVEMGSTNWIPSDINLYIAGGGYYSVVKLSDSTHAVLTNVGGVGCAAAGTVIPALSRVIAVGQAAIGSGITSVFGRSGPAITALLGDYGSTKITNFSSAPGATVNDALTYLRFSPKFPLWRSGAAISSITVNDRRRLIRITGGGVSVITVPTQASQAFTEGDEIVFLAETDDPISFVGAGGVTVHQGAFIPQEWVFYTLTYLTGEEWILTRIPIGLKIVDADVSATAAIAGTKIDPDFGGQNIYTAGTCQAAVFGDATTGLAYNASSLSSTQHDFQVNGIPVVKFTNGNFVSYCQNNYLGINQSSITLGTGTVNATGTLASFSINATDGSGSGTYKGGSCILRGGNALTGTGTGGDALIKGGDGSTANGNVAIGNLPFSFQDMARGVFIANVTALPSANPAAGGFLYVESGALKYRGSSGTVTTLGPA